MGENVNTKITGLEKLGALKLSGWEFSSKYENRDYASLSAADQYSICMAYDSLPQEVIVEKVLESVEKEKEEEIEILDEDDDE